MYARNSSMPEKENSLVKTFIDKLVDKIRQNDDNTALSELSKEFGVSEDIIERLTNLLAQKGILKVSYPVNIIKKPTVKVSEPLTPPSSTPFSVKDKKLIESYTLQSDFVDAKVNIWDVPDKDVLVYELIKPLLELPTNAFLDCLIDELAKNTSISFEDITDPRKIAKLKDSFFKSSYSLIKNELPQTYDSQIKMLAGMMLHKIYGLGDIELILSDEFLEEITINGANNPLSVFHKKHGWLESTHKTKDEEEIYNFISQIGRKSGRDISSLNPLMDAHLSTGDRVAATLFPISTAGNTVTIRRFSRNPWTIINFIDPKVNCISVEVAALLWLAVQYELNVMVAGGTASGKTSILNAVTSLIPATQRIISIEDTREISLPLSLTRNWVPLTSRNPNPEGKGEVSMLDLMVASLRMRPDRIVVGEVRRKRQAEAMFEAMHTGHSVCCTLHADTISQVLRRLVEPPIQIPKSEIEALHLILVQYRDRKKGARRMLELAEVLSGGEKVDINYLYRWRPSSDKFEKTNESIRIIEELNLHTGMTPDEIKKDLEEKEAILDWMLKHELKDMDSVGQIMRTYYKTPDKVIDAAKKNESPKKIMQK